MRPGGDRSAAAGEEIDQQAGTLFGPDSVVHLKLVV